MKEECLICKAPLEYLETDELMECAICHKKENSKTRCVNGHYVCNDCHTRGMDTIIGLCIAEKSKNPIEIINKMMDLPFCHMHGPEHHVMVGAALLTAYQNAGGQIDLPAALTEMMNRGKSVPGGACGFWGACGAGISSGMFISIISKSTPLANEPFALSHKMTAKSLDEIGNIGGPRCCKRTCYLALMEAIPYINEKLDLNIKFNDALICKYSDQNKECLKINCPFFERHPRNSEEGCPITVPGQMMPKKDPAKDCACQYEPVDMAESTCYINWEKPDGAFVKKDEVICEAEADKKVIEFTAGCDGYLTHKIENGDYFNAGSIIGYIKSRK